MLFHKDVFIPANLVSQHKKMTLALKYSKHAEKERFSDKYGFIEKLDYLDTRKCDIIEMEFDDVSKCVSKVVYRLTANEKLDVVIVVVPGITRTCLVKTVWYNEKNDTHKTLDVSKYFNPRLEQC